MNPSIATRTDSVRSKRSAIVAAAIDRFASDGFEHTKWAAIAGDVGIGEATLYYYYESKAHCLLTIMRTELTRFLERFQRATGPLENPNEALRVAVRAAYLGVPRDAQPRRILCNHLDLLSAPRLLESEERERRHSRALVRAIEQGWASLIRRGVESGDFPARDADLSARLALALVVAVWGWYRPDDQYTLDEIGLFTSEAVLRLVA
ncbi:TetR/AcrR family transcriptional regulator [Nocardioides bizhenqiangii]|uniref:TetR family transcriptional regulator n=1 Tax=Nocardioides bizhenqiangii TaxID=3095076 RepID=A0ABZ0ZMW2_9ACTN|nr:TetR family transcriptional regulator [Nocardioides sp. HM61]WQQ25395.1 TetR family transcriptional regulator [Nocardioides sp. HM61]